MYTTNHTELVASALMLGNFAASFFVYVFLVPVYVAVTKKTNWILGSISFLLIGEFLRHVIPVGIGFLLVSGALAITCLGVKKMSNLLTNGRLQLPTFNHARFRLIAVITTIIAIVMMNQVVNHQRNSEERIQRREKAEFASRNQIRR